jgi:hypothetical protein
MTPTSTLPQSGVGESLRSDHRLSIKEIELVGGFRKVALNPGLNFVVGDITTGKTTFVRLLKASLGTVPDALPPEVSAVRAMNVFLQLRAANWRVYRPLVTTASAPVEIANVDDDPDGDAIRLRATGADGSYSRFLLDHLGLPAVSVPEGSSSTARLNPVSMTDWLGYCIITGDDLDSNVFGHDNEFRNRKRRWVFQLAYGYYDAGTLQLVAERRGLELRLDGLDQEAGVIRRFLDKTPFADAGVLSFEIDRIEKGLADLRTRDVESAREVSEIPEVSQLRAEVLETRLQADQLREIRGLSNSQIADLIELKRQLVSQSAKLTRAIVAQDWMVDFDFVVCPRCGNPVEPSDDDGDACYLCHQPKDMGNPQEVLLAEQDRVVSQITETDVVLEDRQSALRSVEGRLSLTVERLGSLARRLDQATDSFVSDRAASIRARSREEAEMETERTKLIEYQGLLARAQDQSAERAELETQVEDLTIKIESKRLELSIADANVSALEKRMLEYLEELHIPHLGDMLTVRINPTTYMPEVSGRTFDELSSQGLKTLVNVAHSLAHHTVAIDRELPLPGLLVLDGLSANAGHEGFDQARVEDVYRLLLRVSDKYEGRLQIIAVDNDIPASLANEVRPKIALSLSQSDRLIRSTDPDTTLDKSVDHAH